MAYGRNVTLLLLMLGYAGWACGGCREAQLPRDCEALCSFDRHGQVTSCELRAAVLLVNNSKYEISLMKVMPVLGKLYRYMYIYLACYNEDVVCYNIYGTLVSVAVKLYYPESVYNYTKNYR